MKFIFRVLLAAAVIVPSVLPSAWAKGPEIRVLSVSGAPSVQVKRGKTWVEAKEGAVLKPHDEFKTGPAFTVRLLFPDQSQVWVGRSSSVQINSAGEVLQLVYLNSGQIRVQVPRSFVPSSEKKIKFMVKTPAATMGVRGTDFVVDSADEGKKYELHTFQGEVVAAKGDEALIKNQVVSVPAGQFIAGEINQAIPKPAAFSVEKYEGELYKHQPEFEKYSETPLTQASSGGAGLGPDSSSSGPSGGSGGNPRGVRQRLENSMQQDQNRIDRAAGD